MGRFIGLLVVAFGVVWLLRNFGMIPMWSYGEILAVYWPVLLLYFGVVGLWRTRRHGIAGMIWPLALLALGAGFQLELLDILDFYSFILPMALILVGMALLFSRRSENRYGMTEIAYETERHVQEVIDGSLPDSLPQVHGKQMVGSLKIGGAGWQLQSARYAHKLGDVKVDLRETEIPLGETVLEISCNIGDIDVRLPEDVDVWIQAHAKMGDVKVFEQRNSGANASLTYQSVGYEEAERKLKLLLFMKMGDIDVKRVE